MVFGVGGDCHAGGMVYIPFIGQGDTHPFKKVHSINPGGR
jgi:hypothetical protein